MSNLTLRHTLVGLAAGLLLAAPGVWAQAPASGAHDTPRPDELEPGVNTSATPPQSGAASGTSSGAAPAKVAPAGAGKTTKSASGRSNTGGVASSTHNGGVAAPNGGAAATNSGSAANAGAATNGGPVAANKSGKEGAPEGNKGADSANAAPRAGKAPDHLQLDTTQITGNQELPKVLYIVPWKRSDLGDLVGRPPNSLLDEVLEPIDRDVFKRENRYYDALKPDAAGAAGGAKQGSGEQR